MKKIASLVLLVFLSGCAVFPGNEVADVVLPASNAVDKPSLSYRFLVKTGFGSPQDASAQVTGMVEPELTKALEKSGYFSRVAKNDPKADIQLDLTMINSGSGAAMIPAIITGLSFYVIPSWATDNFEVVAVATNQKGKRERYSAKDHTTLVQWLPMMFVFPVKNFSVVPEVRENMYRKVILDMHNDGLFE